MTRSSKLLLYVSCALPAAAALADTPTAVQPVPISAQRASSISRLHTPPPAVAPVAPGSKQQLNPQPLPPKVWGMQQPQSVGSAAAAGATAQH